MNKRPKTNICRTHVLHLNRKFYFGVISLFCIFVIYAVLTYKLFTVQPGPALCNIEIPLSQLSPQKDPNENLYSRVSYHYGIPLSEARSIVGIAMSYGDKVFPTYQDILSVIAIESSFNRKAENMGAFGLMQIQFGQHKQRAGTKERLLDPWHNIQVGSAILKEYYGKLHSKNAAILAYKDGIGSYLAGELTQSYLDRFLREKSWLSRV